MDVSVVVAGREDDRPPEEALSTAVIADELGFGEVWIAENPTWDTFALATAIGTSTERIAITVGPLPVSVRDPATIMRGLSSIDALTGHTVGVAVGTSSKRVVEGLHGRSRSGATKTMEQTAGILRGFFDGEEVEDMDHPFRRRLPPPDGRLTVAAFGDRAISIAARYADRMVLDLVTPQQVVGIRNRLEEAALRADRPSPTLAAWLPAAVEPDEASARQVMASVVGYLTVAGYDEVFIEAGFEDAVTKARAGAPTDELLDALPPKAVETIGLSGDIDRVRSRLDDYDKAGLDEVAVVAATAGDPGGEHTLSTLAELV